MANNLGYYNPQFYAAEALIQLRKALGVANTVYHGYEGERNAFRKGDTINIKRPGVFTVSDAPAVAQDLNPDSIQISLDRWKEVKFKLTDKELALTQDVIISDHIAPAAYAIADYMDQDLITLFPSFCGGVGATYNTASPATFAVQHMARVRMALFDGRVPMRDPSSLFCMVDGVTESNILGSSTFNQQAGAGDIGVRTQVTGALGPKLGINWFANQNKMSLMTAGTVSVSALLINNGAGYAAGISTINLDAASVTGTLTPGCILDISGQRYRVTNTVTASTNAFASVTIAPALTFAVVDNQAVTVVYAGDSAATNECAAYHRNSMALVSAPLSEMGNELGARIFSVTDPVTGISLRARLYYVGNSSEVHVALDVLYGIKMLEPRLGVRWQNKYV